MSAESIQSGDYFRRVSEKWGCESPIEQLFAAAWLELIHEYSEHALTVLPGEFVALYGSIPDVTRMTPLHYPQVDFVSWQVPLDNYRVDFAVGRIVYSLKALDPSSDDGPKDVLLKLPALIIECDGHDFHERTKEQAQRDKYRDRQLQSMGYRVIRFTGSEIYRDPAKCANEVDAIFESLRSPRVREAGSYE